MRQILYLSSSTVQGDRGDLANILEQSRHNNAIDGITGLLWSDGVHFLQVFEGPTRSVEATFARILNDDRHHDIVLLHNERIAERQFGGWSMAHRRTDDAADLYDVRMQRLMSRAADHVRARFLSIMQTGAI